MKISIVIPNFNGENLLKKNLPNILDAGVEEVIICDDGSTDGSLEFLENLKIENALTAGRQGKLKILIHKKNRGFIVSVNELFYEATGDVVVLLNNDVYVEKNFLNPLMKHFDNPKVFAVNLHEKGEGPSVAFWKDGFYEFKRGEEKKQVQKSAWASGGSAAFRKSIWRELGGFDPMFAPFYWEDVDLSFRAIKAGYEVFWEPDSRVRHEHETTIKKFNKRYVNWIQQRNQFLFIWKNIKDSKLIKVHKKALFKRLFGDGVGYWIPYLWALLESRKIKKDIPKSRTDEEVINYASP